MNEGFNWTFDLGKGKDVFVEVIGKTKAVDGEVVYIDPFIFISTTHKPILVQMWSGKPWAFKLGSHKKWISLQELTKEAVFEFAHAQLTKEEFDLYPKPE